MKSSIAGVMVIRILLFLFGLAYIGFSTIKSNWDIDSLNDANKSSFIIKFTSESLKATTFMSRNNTKEKLENSFVDIGNITFLNPEYNFKITHTESSGEDSNISMMGAGDLDSFLIVVSTNSCRETHSTSLKPDSFKICGMDVTINFSE